MSSQLHPTTSPHTRTRSLHDAMAPCTRVPSFSCRRRQHQDSLPPRPTCCRAASSSPRRSRTPPRARPKRMRGRRRHVCTCLRCYDSTTPPSRPAAVPRRGPPRCWPQKPRSWPLPTACPWQRRTRPARGGTEPLPRLLPPPPPLLPPPSSPLPLPPPRPAPRARNAEARAWRRPASSAGYSVRSWQRTLAARYRYRG